MRRLLALAVLLLLPLAHAEADQRCASLLTARCQQCHYKTRICQALGTKWKWGWKSTVKRMKDYGAKISQEEADYLVACLAAAPKGAPHVCKD